MRKCYWDYIGIGVKMTITLVLLFPVSQATDFQFGKMELGSIMQKHGYL